MFCDLTKEFLSKRKLPYTDRDITADPAALDELKRLGYMTTPVIVIGESVIVGFDREKLEMLNTNVETDS
jgi:glutaredoxin